MIPTDSNLRVGPEARGQSLPDDHKGNNLAAESPDYTTHSQNSDSSADILFLERGAAKNLVVLLWSGAHITTMGRSIYKRARKN